MAHLSDTPFSLRLAGGGVSRCSQRDKCLVRFRRFLCFTCALVERNQARQNIHARRLQLTGSLQVPESFFVIPDALEPCGNIHSAFKLTDCTFKALISVVE